MEYDYTRQVNELAKKAGLLEELNALRERKKNLDLRSSEILKEYKGNLDIEKSKELLEELNRVHKETSEVINERFKLEVKIININRESEE